MDGLGLLRIRVERGINLAVRDTRSSDPYVLIQCESQVSPTTFCLLFYLMNSST